MIDSWCAVCDVGVWLLKSSSWLLPIVGGVTWLFAVPVCDVWQ